ncbi:RNA methyltransferase [candidate division KSB1 bacterium]|nr:RNA methyltransferase [candidate division KSB1 bacterium]
MITLEGKICVQAALEARARKLSLIVVRHGLHHENAPELFALAKELQVPVKTVSREEIDAMAGGKTHGGILALGSPRPPWEIERFFDFLKRSSRPPFLLLLEGVDDVQNLGFVMRSAEALGVQAILLKKHLWDFDEAAVSRSSSGAFERMPLVVFDQPQIILPKMRNYDVAVYGCIANVKRRIYDVDLTRGILLCLGGEKRGLSAAVRSQCDQFIQIPMVSDIGSLSLTHSASIVMAEAMRQRLMRIDVVKQQIEERGEAGE